MFVYERITMVCKYLIVLYVIVSCVSAVYAQPPDTLWTKRYHHSPYVRSGGFYTLLPDTSGCFSFAGYIYTPGSYHSGQFASWMYSDSTGEILKHKYYHYEGDTSPVIYASDRNNDGTFIYAGQSGSKILLLKVDSNGDTMWTRQFGGDGIYAALAVVSSVDSGYVIAGSLENSCSTSILLMKISTNGDSLWTRTYGGSIDDKAKAILETSEGGYIITGQRRMNGNADLFIMKTNAVGDSVWAKNYGASGPEQGNAIVQTEDNGYYIVGVQLTTGMGEEMYMVRTDSLGDTLWTKSMGSVSPEYNDELNDITALPDQQYIVAGSVRNTGYPQAFVAKVDDNGDTIWTNDEIAGCYESVEVIDSNRIVTAGYYNPEYYGQCLICLMDSDNGSVITSNHIYGTEYENVYSLEISQDNGYVLAGWKKKFPEHADFDVLLMKTDSDGNSIWERTYGEDRNDFGYDLIRTNDNGYMIIGTTFSFGADRCDMFLLKTDQDGNEEWMKTYGKTEWDFGYAVLQTEDNGYIIVGEHSHCEIYGLRQASALFIMRTDVIGDTLWTRCYVDNGVNKKYAYDFCKGINNGFVIAGYYMTDISIMGGGLLFKIDDNGDSLWTITLPGARFNSIIQASDNGYLAVGTKEWGGMNSNSDLCLVKINDSGVIEWIKNYGIYGPWGGRNEGHSITLTDDGGYIAAGYSQDSSCLYLVRTDSQGDSLWTKRIRSISFGSFVDKYTFRRTQDGGYVFAGGNDMEYTLYNNHHIVMIKLGPETGIKETADMPKPKPFLSVRPTIFNRRVIIDYQIPYIGKGELNIYDITGRLVRTVAVNENIISSTFKWHGFNNNGLPVPSGTYYIVLRSGMHEVKQKIIFVR